MDVSRHVCAYADMRVDMRCCVLTVYFSAVKGPTGCPGSVPDSETERMPWTT